MPLRQLNGYYFSKYKNKSSMKPSGVSRKILYIPFSKVWDSLPLVSPFRPTEAQRCRGSSGTNHSQSYYTESHCLHGESVWWAVSAGFCADNSRDHINLHGSLMRGCLAQGRPAPQAFSWLSGGSWRGGWRGSVCTKQWKRGHTQTRGKCIRASGVTAVTLYFKIVF